MSEHRHYMVGGYYTLTAPGRVCQVDIYFILRGNLITIRGADLFTKERAYLGWWYSHNMAPEKKREMVDFVRKHKSNWVRTNANPISD